VEEKMEKSDPKATPTRPMEMMTSIKLEPAIERAGFNGKDRITGGRQYVLVK
jgi:hypothetical protein